MGEVYRARDTKLNRDVAIKVLPDLLAADPDRLARFEREARAVAALSHPNMWKELMPSQVAGTRLTQVQPTRDGRAFVHTYSQLLSNLYVAEGLPR